MVTRYCVLVLSPSDAASILSITRVVEPSRPQTNEETTPHSVTVAKTIFADETFSNGEISNQSWIPWEHLDEDRLKPRCQETPHQRPSLAECLLQVSDTLPYAGVCVNVILLHPHLYSDDQGSNSYLPLFGALKKLCSWHNAEITIVQEEVSPVLKELADFTGAVFTPSVTPFPWKPVLWRGKVAVMNKVVSEGHKFPGFELWCSDAEDVVALYRRLNRRCSWGHAQELEEPVYMGRMLEVLDEVDIRTIPSFMLTKHTLTLSLWRQDPMSAALLEELHSQDQTGLIARVAVYHKDVMGDCSQRLSSQAWKESLMANIEYIQEQEEDLLSPFHFVHVLLTNTLTDHCQTTPPQSIRAVLLVDSTELNSSLFTMTVSKQDTDDHDIRFRKYIDDLPSLTGKTLRNIHNGLASLQREMLAEWVEEVESCGEQAVMTSDMLSKFLAQIQERFLGEILNDKELTHCTPDDMEVPLPILESELEMDPTDWPERHALQHRDSQKREMRRYQSSDNMCLSSPLHPDDGNVIVEVKDFLKLFKTDGSASLEKLSPIRQAKRKLTKLSSQGESTLQWPECKDTLFHGIDYYKDRISERNEKHFHNMRDKFLKEETCSSFTTKQILPKKKTSTLVRHRSGRGNLMSPTRKSPRQLKMEEDVRSYGSQSSRQKMLRQHSGLKSPHKRQSLPSEQLRRSPRKQASGSHIQRFNSDTVQPPPKRKRLSDPEPRPASQDCTQADKKEDKERKLSRSERHKKKLEQIVLAVLTEHGVSEDQPIFKSCLSKLYQVTKFFVKALPNSRNLSQEMKNIAQGQVTQVVDLERRRQSIRKSRE